MEEICDNVECDLCNEMKFCIILSQIGIPCISICKDCLEKLLERINKEK